jgi:hypothetical protein
VKAVGEAFEVGLRIWFDQAKLVAGDAFKRRAFAGRLADQKPRELIRHLQQILRDADIDDQDAGHQIWLHTQRRQQCAAIGLRTRALRELEVGKRFRRDQHCARRRHEGPKIVPANRGCVADVRGQRHRLDAQ